MDFYGEYRHTVDSKNRLFIPAKFREQLGEKFYITRKVEHALIIYSENAWQDLQDKLNSKPDSVVGIIKQFIFPKTVDAAPDANGRVILSGFLMDYAGIGKENKSVVVIGVGDHVEIWSESAWDKQEETMKAQDFNEILKELGL